MCGKMLLREARPRGVEDVGWPVLMLTMARMIGACFAIGVLVTLATGIFPASAQRADGGGPPKPSAIARTTTFKSEIVVRTVRNLRNRSEIVSLLDMAARHHVEVVNLAVKQDDDDEVPSGLVFYASKIAPRAPGYKTFDVLAETIAEAHQRGIKVRAWVPQFHDQIAARKNPGWEMRALVGKDVVPFAGSKRKEYFINPLNPAVQAYQRSIVAEIARNYDVDGIVLDWVRFDDYNMDLGPETRTSFKAAFGYDPIGIDFSTDNLRRTQWNGWRTAQIGAYVKSVRQDLDEIKPGLDLGVFILPPEFAEVAQDAGLFSDYVNFLSPMVYFEDWGYPASWVNTNVLPQATIQARGKALIPVLDTDWSDAAYEEILASIRRKLPAITTLSWFVYGQWTEATFQRIDTLRSK